MALLILLQVMQGLCNGESSCSVEAANNVFGDPCRGTEKYLTATWKCEIGDHLKLPYNFSYNFPQIN